MSNKTTLQSNNALISQNNTDLQALIDTANALPEAGGSGGGASVETCSVTINFVDGASGYPEFGGLVQLGYAKVVSGNVEYTEVTINSDSTSISDVHKGSIFMFYISDPPNIFGGSGLVCQNLNLVYYSNSEIYFSSHFSFFISDSNGTITIS